MKNLTDKHGQLTAAWKKKDLKSCKSLLQEIKLLLTEVEFLPTEVALENHKQVKKIFFIHIKWHTFAIFLCF